MPSSYTTSLRIELQATGENANTWGGIANTSFGTLMEHAVAGHTSIALSDANYTLTTASGASDEARYSAITFTGSLTATRDITCPQVAKTYLIKNDTGQTLNIKSASGTAAAVPAGVGWVRVVTDGTNFALVKSLWGQIAGTLANQTDLQGALDAKMTNPMTTAGDIIYGGASGTPTRLAVGTNGHVLTLSAGVPTWAAVGSGSATWGGITGTLGDQTDLQAAFDLKAPLASPTFTGTTTAATTNVNGRLSKNVTAVGALNIDLNEGNEFTKTINANSTFTFSNIPASRAVGWLIRITHTSGTLSWPAAVRWPNGVTPTFTTGKTHIVMFYTDNGGTSIWGSALVGYTT